MSLINEALKRTRDASYRANGAAAGISPGYRVSSDNVPSSWRSGAVPATAALVAGLALAAVAAMLFVRSHSDRPEPSALAATTVTPAPAPTVPAATRPPTPAASTATLKTAEDQLVARLLDRVKTQTPPPAPAAPPPPPLPPQLRLQGITSEGATREAMINGYTVRVGEVVEGARITAIEPSLVRLNFGSQELVLRLR